MKIFPTLFSSNFIFNVPIREFLVIYSSLQKNRFSVRNPPGKIPTGDDDVRQERNQVQKFKNLMPASLCSVRFTLSDRYTPADVYAMHWELDSEDRKKGHALINYAGREILCFEAWNWRYYPEIPYVYLYCDTHLKFPKNEPSLTDCVGYDCWESQLSTVTRIEIVDIMNRYRNLVAEGSCETWCEKNEHKLAFELRWNYYWERNATGYLRTCAASKFIPKVFTRVYSSGLVFPAYKELILTSFKMETGLQSELRSILWRLMYENHLRDWDDKSQFRRGDMTDVACAFVCRRNVDLFVTALNETVVNGIVGYFSCVFLTLLVNISDMDYVTSNEPIPRPFETTPEPSLENCKAIHPTAVFYGAEFNYYPALCRHPGAYAAGLPIFDACDFRPRDVPGVCQGSAYSPITWEEKFYGLIFRFIETFPNDTTLVDVQGQCHVPPPTFPQPDRQGTNILNYDCTLQEIVTVQANPKLCSGWNCADSQLTDATRVQIVQLLNDARNRIANGDCSDECAHPCDGCNINIQYCNMVTLWHWFLERKASEVVKNCPTKNSIRAYLSYDDDPFPADHETTYDEITLIFDLPYYEGQLALPKTFIKLFWLNAFVDWTEYGYFRRANAQFIGCSIISRPYTLDDVEIEAELNFYNGIPTHMVCIFASINGSFHSILAEPITHSCCPMCRNDFHINPCWLKFQKNATPFENLCSPDELLLFPMNCQVGNRCKGDSVSKAWYIQYEGLTLTQSLNGSLIPINRLAFNSIGVLYARKYCRYIIFLFLLQIWLWILILYLIYSCDDINIKELLKESSTPTIEFRLPKFTLTKKDTSSPKDDRSFRAKKRKRGTFHGDVESKREIPSSGVLPDTDASDAGSIPAKKSKKRTLPTEMRTTPAAKKVRIRETRPEDVDDESEWEPLTGPTKAIGVGVVGPKKIFTGRPPKERKAPKRAKTTPLPPIIVKRGK